MRLLDHTFDRPEENLACDEVLLDLAVEGTGGECLRIWESSRFFVVVGYTNEVQREVDLAACATAGIPILRRCSGGGTVLQGPGCLNYALILSTDRDPALESISGANAMILQQHVRALHTLLPTLPHIQGHTDLVLNDRKFSGNSQRRKGHYLLFHGTLLYDFPLDQIQRFLPLPSIAPGYRAGRPHTAFLTNLPTPRSELTSLLRKTWDAHTPCDNIPLERVTALSDNKYLTRAWTFRR